MEKEFWCHVCSIQFLDEGGLVGHESSYEHLERKRRKENNDKVRPMPFDDKDFWRQAYKLLEVYVTKITPKIDPNAAEKQLFDQVVLMFITHGSGLTQAVESAMHIIRARRTLEKETES